MTHLEKALQYVDEGWPVFPCRPDFEEGVDYRTREPRTFKPKSPLTQYGFRDATKTKRIVERWWRDRPDALIGVPTGSKTKFWVLDIDAPFGGHEHDGRPWLAEMEAKHGKLETRIATSPTGGKHYYWKHVDGVHNKVALAPGVDTRGEGGFVCVPGSVMPDGTFYEWDNDLPIADAPAWLIDLVVRKAQPEPPKEYSKRDYGDAPPVVAEVVDLLSYIHPDCNYGDWVSVLMALHATFGEDGLTIADQWSAGGKKYRKGEVATKWRKFKSGGGIGMGTICTLAKAGGADLSEISRRHKDRGGDDWISKEDAARLAGGLLKPKAAPAATEAPTSAPEPEPDEKPKRAVTATEFIVRDPKLIPRREFLFGQHYVRKYLTATFGAGGGGKSANAVTEALAMATGRPLFDGAPREPVRVWYVNCEDPDVEIERRFAGAILHYKIKPGDARYHLRPGFLFADSGRTQDFVVMKEDGKKTLVSQPIVDAIIEEIREKKIDVMIVDPFVSTHEVEENDNNKIQRVASQWVRIAEATNCSIELIHHVTKGNMEITADSGRGAGALKDKCRSVRTINSMSEGEADAAGIPKDDRFGYFRMDFGKANLAKRSGRSDWRKFASVKLGNGKGNMASINSDEIGVVTAWQWPSAEKIIEDGFSDEQLELIKVKIANEDYKFDGKGSPWAGEAIAYALEMDMDDDGWRRKARKMLDALIKEGVLDIKTEKDPISRKVKKYVRVA